jgi:hypothetical protein
MQASHEGFTLNGNRLKREYKKFEILLLYSSDWEVHGHGLFVALYPS